MACLLRAVVEAAALSTTAAALAGRLAHAVVADVASRLPQAVVVYEDDTLCSRGRRILNWPSRATARADPCAVPAGSGQARAGAPHPPQLRAP